MDDVKEVERIIRLEDEVKDLRYAVMNMDAVLAGIQLRMEQDEIERSICEGLHIK